MGFTTATVVEQNRKDTIFIGTGSDELDKMLQGEVGFSYESSVLVGVLY